MVALRAGKACPTWDGVKSIMGLKSNKFPVSLCGRTDAELANEWSFLTVVYFGDFSDEPALVRTMLL